MFLLLYVTSRLATIKSNGIIIVVCMCNNYYESECKESVNHGHSLLIYISYPRGPFTSGIRGLSRGGINYLNSLMDMDINHWQKVTVEPQISLMM